MDNNLSKYYHMTNFRKGLLLFWIYFKAMAFAVTGGMAATPTLIYEIVTKRQLLTEEEYLEIIALSNSLPGIIGINNSIFTGYKIAGPFGSLMAFLYQGLPENRYVRGAINGIRAVSVAILFDMGVRVFLKYRKNAFGILMMLFALAVPLLTKISAFYTILLSGLIGILYYIYNQQNKKQETAGEDK